MERNTADGIMLSLRRISHAIDQHNKQISDQFKFTVPQIMILRHLLVHGACTPGSLAKAVFLSKATVTGIVDRLESKALITRARSSEDRRKQFIELTDEGRSMAGSMPWPLQERFANSLARLDSEELRHIDETLRHLVTMMETPSPDQVETPNGADESHGKQ